MSIRALLLGDVNAAVEQASESQVLDRLLRVAGLEWLVRSGVADALPTL